MGLRLLQKDATHKGTVPGFFLHRSWTEISCQIYTPPHLPSDKKKDKTGDWESRFGREISVPAGKPNPVVQPVTNYRITLIVGLVSVVLKATHCFGNQIHFRPRATLYGLYLLSWVRQQNFRAAPCVGSS